MHTSNHKINNSQQLDMVLMHYLQGAQEVLEALSVVVEASMQMGAEVEQLPLPIFAAAGVLDLVTR